MQEIIKRNQMFEEDIHNTRLKMQQFVLDQEIWKPVNGYDYSVSNQGRVRSNRFNRILKLSKNNQGYLNFNISQDRKMQNVTIHRLVANAFIPNPENKTYVDHIDNNKLNNNVDNLRWFIRQEKLIINNKSGCNGVSWHETSNKWVAQMYINKKKTSLGYFKDKEDAIKARQEACLNNFHDRFGK
jgi:hypothetical protein